MRHRVARGMRLRAGRGTGGRLLKALGFPPVGLLLCLALAGVACESPSGSSPDLPPEPTPAPTLAPTPIAAPTPATTTAPAANRPPTVTVQGGGDCHPSAPDSAIGFRPCWVTFEAAAEDPDGDSLSYSWSGCASGTQRRTQCEVRELGRHRASVEARDGRGGRASASGQAQGANRPPAWWGPNPRRLDPLPSGALLPFAGGQPDDPDGDEDPNVLCTRVAFSVSGPCRAGLASCGGVGDVFDVDFTTTTGPGTCVFVATTRDSWGAEGRYEIRFEVLGS